MITRFFINAALLATFGYASLAAFQSGVDVAGKPPARIREEVASPNVEILNRHASRLGCGTCIEVGGEVLVLTAAHVVHGYADPQQTRLTDADGNKRTYSTPARHLVEVSHQEDFGGWRSEGETLWVSADLDLALVRLLQRVPAIAVKKLLTRDSLALGEEVWYIGSPAGIYGRLERSIVAATRHEAGKRYWYGTNGCGYPGSSGGGVYVRRGDHYILAGAVLAGYTGCPKGMTLFCPPSDIHRFLDSYREYRKSLSSGSK